MTTDFIHEKNTTSGMRRTDNINNDGGKSRFIAMIDGKPLTLLWTNDVTNNKNHGRRMRPRNGQAQPNDEKAPGFSNQRSTYASEKNENEAANALLTRL